jgi:hypothetical protein
MLTSTETLELGLVLVALAERGSAGELTSPNTNALRKRIAEGVLRSANVQVPERTPQRLLRPN